MKRRRFSSRLQQAAFCLAVCAVLATLAGCRRLPPPTPPSPPASSASNALDALTASQAPQPPSGPAEGGASDPAAAEPTGQISLGKLNEALRMYFQVDPNLPDDLAVLYRAKLLPAVPVPPPGKKYVVDKRKVEVKLVNQ